MRTASRPRTPLTGLFEHPVKRDFDSLEARRLQAARLLKKGLSEAEVARQVGVHRQSVNRWAKTLAQSGRSALKKAERAGRPPALSEKDLRKLARDLKRGPEVFGYETGLWTTQRVGRLIEERFGVRFHTRHVWWLLRQMGWSSQRPVGRALERDEEAIEQWKKHKWPALKKKPAGRDERSSSSTRAD